jgi:hypothetical protein
MKRIITLFDVTASELQAVAGGNSTSDIDSFVQDYVREQMERELRRKQERQDFEFMTG